MAGLELSAAGDILKLAYQPKIREQLNNGTKLLSQLEKNTEDFQGLQAKVAIHTGSNSGVGPRLEGGTLPTAGKQAYKQATLETVNQYGVIQVTGKAIKQMATDVGSYERAVDSESKRLVNDLKFEVNVQCYTPQTGVIGTTTAAPTTASAGVDSVTTLRRLRIGGQYDYVVAGGDGIVWTVIVNTIDESTLSLTHTLVSSGASSASSASGNRIVRSGVAPSTSAALIGLETAIDSAGSLYSVDPATYGVWKSTERAVSAALTDTVLERALQDVEIASGVQPNLVLTTAEIERGYANSLKTLKRFEGERLQLKGGWKALDVTAGGESVALMYDRHCTDGTVYGVRTDAFQEYEGCDWEWADEDGNVLKWVANVDSFVAYMRKFHIFATSNRNQHFKLTSVTGA
jgi:hypothetical protein